VDERRADFGRIPILRLLRLTRWTAAGEESVRDD
jgi:hypothetical protein